MREGLEQVEGKLTHTTGLAVAPNIENDSCYSRQNQPSILSIVLQSVKNNSGGATGTRTLDLFHAMEAL